MHPRPKCEVIFARALTQEELAQSLPPNPRTGKAVARQAVSNSLKRGHWGTVEEAKKQKLA
jgi:hypothetical protein